MGRRDLDLRVVHARFHRGTHGFYALQVVRGENRVFAKIYISTSPYWAKYTPDAAVSTADDARWGEYNDLHFTLTSREAPHQYLVIELHKMIMNNGRLGAIANDFSLLDRVGIPMLNFQHGDRNARPPVTVSLNLNGGSQIMCTYKLGRYVTSSNDNLRTIRIAAGVLAISADIVGLTGGLGTIFGHTLLQ